MSISWTPCTVKLADLRPWADNPRMSTKKQAQRLLDSWTRFGQVQAIAIGPQNEVYDGHQRLSALLTVHGPSYQVDARRSDRELTDEERRALVVTLHAGAVGSWNWDNLANWDAGELQEWGFDSETLMTWQRDVGALGNLIGSESNNEWQGMPEFEQEDVFGSAKDITVHFASVADIEVFSRLVDQKITEKTKYIWFPKQEHADLKALIAHES